MRYNPIGLYFKVASVFVFTFVLGALLIHLNERNQILQNQKAAMDVASMHGHLMQEQVNRSLSATYALAAVLRQGKGTIDQFEALASEMLPLYGGISALQLAPKGVISRIVPLAGNEAALGHNLLQDPKRNKEAFAAVETRKLTLAGPFTLRQGGVAVVGRLPIFLPDSAGNEQFWGFATALIRISDLLAASKLNAGDMSGYDYELWRIHPDTGQRDVIAASAAMPLQEAMSYRIEMPNGEWTLGIARPNGWHSSMAILGVEAAVALLVGALMALLTFNVLKQPHVLRREVELRTRELRESERELEKRVAERTAELSAANAALQAEQATQQALIKKLEDAQNQLLQSEKMASIGQLAAGVAHEINNPIGFVNSNLATLRQYSDDLLAIMDTYEAGVDPLLDAYPETRANVVAIKEKADLWYLREDLPNLLKETQDGVIRVKRIVQDLKEFSHVDESEWQVADLHRGLDSTLNMVWNELKYKADVVKEYGQIPPVDCIISQLNQVFMNLFVNAAQAIEGRGVITVRSGLEGDRVRIEVADTGKGIAPENLNRVFEPFFTTKPVGQGTGLGLSLSYGIIQKHGGSIEVQSELGKGSVFRICLPVSRAAEPVDSRAGDNDRFIAACA